MHFYSIPRLELLATPVKTFWLLSRNVSRIQAENDQRQLSVMTSSQSGEGWKALTAALKNEVGEVARQDPVFEHGKLKAMMKKITTQDQARAKR